MTGGGAKQRGRILAVVLSGAFVLPCMAQAEGDWAKRRIAELSQRLRGSKATADAQLDELRSLVELKLKAPARYVELRRALPAQAGEVSALFEAVERHESRANLMITMLAREEARGQLERTLQRMRRTGRAEYRQFKAAVDTYLTSFMEVSYSAFGRSPLCAALRGRSGKAGSVASVYAAAMMHLGTLRGLFATVEAQ